MQTAIIVHGMPSKEEYFDSTLPSPSNAHWFPWLQKSLLERGVIAQTPEMPTPYDPSYEEYSAILESFPIDEETILIGHSLGAGFLLKYLAQQQLPFRQLVLVAPWIDLEGELPSDFFKDTFAQSVLHPERITLFYSNDDSVETGPSVAAIREHYPNMEEHIFSNKGHFCQSDIGPTFPQLLEALDQQ